jgi:hypothetical protein
VYAKPEPSSANRTRYYVESTKAKRLAIIKLDHLTAHTYCLHIMQSIFSLNAEHF